MAAVATGDTPAAVLRYRKETGMRYPVYLDDGTMAKAFGVVSSPTCILVEPDGRMTYRGATPPGGKR